MVGDFDSYELVRCHTRRQCRDTGHGSRKVHKDVIAGRKVLAVIPVQGSVLAGRNARSARAVKARARDKSPLIRHMVCAVNQKVHPSGDAGRVRRRLG